MPTETTFTLSIANHMPGAAVNSTKLDSEIGLDPLITIGLGGKRVFWKEDVLQVVFKDSLPQSDRTAFDGTDQKDTLAIQTDATLDPGATPATGDRYLLKDTASLHANFGTITGVGDNDIVEFNGTDFVVDLDASGAGNALVRDTGSDTFQHWNGITWSASTAGGRLALHDNSLSTPISKVHLDNVKLDIYNDLIVTPTLPLDDGMRKISHNYCDACTWWQESTEHIDQATTTGDNTTYSITDHDKLIDLRHGRVTFESTIDDTTVAFNGNTMTNIVPTVKIDSVPIPQAAEDDDQHADGYTINYPAGSVTFYTARTGSPTIVVSFRKSGSSKWSLVPAVGKKIVLTDAEIDVSENIDHNSTFRTVVYGSHSVLTGGVKALLSTKEYKVFHDFQAAARRFWGPIPAGFGGTSGINSPKWSFEWQYSRSDELFDTANYRDLNIDSDKVTLNYMEASIDGDVQFGGDFLTIAFYGHEVSEQ